MRHEIKVGELKNGFRFYSQYDWSGSTNLAGIGVKAGSLHTPPGCVGLPHLVEHLLARESLKYPPREAELIFEKFLGDPDEDINIRIDRVSTHYGFADLFRRKHMLTCLDVMAHFLCDKIITAEGIDVEKAAVLNEYHLRGLDFMPCLLDDLMHGLVYEYNPARFRIDCEPGDLEKIKRSQIAGFVKKQYIAGNMFLIVLGPKFDQVKELAEEYFNDWESKPVPQLAYNHSDDLPALKTIKSVEVMRDIGQFHVGVGFPTENYMSKDSEGLDILGRILAFRLRQRLREGNREFRKGVYRANVWTSRSSVHGLFYATFATVDGEFAKGGERIILEETRKLKEELAGNDEFDAAMTRLDTVYLESFSKNALSLSELIIEAVCNGDDELAHLHMFRSRLRKVTRRKLLSIANKYFTDNYARVLIRPC